MDHYLLDKSNVLYESDANKKWKLLGVGFDSTVTSIPGQRLAPNKIREVLRLKDSPRYVDDLGNVVPVVGNASKTLQRIEEVVEQIKSNVFVFGGEHLISLGVVKGLLNHYKKLQVVAFDAHYDAKHEFDGELLNHSTVFRRIHELGVDVLVIGARRYDEEEADYARKHFLKSLDELDKNIPVYVSIDLDYFDIALAQGCADKESNGATFKEFAEIFEKIANNYEIIGMDIVELNPLLDPSSTTATLAADIFLMAMKLLNP